MSYLQAVLLGIIQGLTEFLPVSSSGHLVILEHIYDLQPQSREMLLFDLMLHLGTVLAVLVFFRQSLKRYASDLSHHLQPALLMPVREYRRTACIRFSILAVVAILATGIFYILFDEIVETGFEKPSVVAICWLITGTFLLLTDFRKKTRRGLRQFGLAAAIIVGLAQGVALFPGVSRSGATICAALLLGLHRRWAGEFSFLIGVPAILGATAVHLLDVFRTPMEGLPWGPILAGTVVSTLVGWFALFLLFWLLRKAKFKYFAFYCYLIGLITLGAVFFR
jgi:undecaprenyl-diphosphatase